MQKARRILLITPNDAPASVCEMGIRSSLSEHPGWTLRRHVGWPTDPPTIRAIQKWAPHGVLTFLSSPPFLFPAGEPVVVGIRNHECPVMVRFEEHRVGALAAETLISLGYKHIRALHLPHAAAETLWFTPRFEGFVRRCAELGIDAQSLAPGNEDLRDGVPLLTDALSRVHAERQHIAVFCGNDYFANCAFQACAKLGLRVPDDVAIIGADDLPGHEAELLGLTSVQIPHFRIGAESIRLMDQVMSGKPPPRHAHIIPVTTVSQRTSTRRVQIEDAIVQAALRFIEAHVSLPLGIDQVAQAAGASRRTLTERFRSVLGASVKDVIDRRRVDYAISLLQAGTHSISTAAAAIGCDDAGNFSRLVSRVTGRSPKHHLRT